MFHEICSSLCWGPESMFQLSNPRICPSPVLINFVCTSSTSHFFPFFFVVFSLGSKLNSQGETITHKHQSSCLASCGSRTADLSMEKIGSLDRAIPCQMNPALLCFALSPLNTISLGNRFTFNIPEYGLCP